MIGSQWANEQYFNPRWVSGLVLWLDGTDPAANGVQPANASSVSSWVDKSTQANNASQGTGANQPTFNTNQIGGKAAIAFSSATKGMSFTLTGFGSGSAAFTTFQVLRFDAGSLSSGGYVTGWGTNAGSQYYSVLSNGGATPKITIDANGNQNGNTTLVGDTNYIWEENYIAASDMSTIALTINGTAQTNSGSSGGAINVVKTSGFVGSLFGSGFGLVGKVGEVIVYNTSLSAIAQGNVRRYLANKWGITA